MSCRVQRRTPVMIQRIFVVIPVQHELELDDVNSAVEETGVKYKELASLCVWVADS